MDTDKSMIGENDKRFLTKAAEGGLMEVQMAQLAQRQASSQAVKDYARQLEQDHTNANKQLMDIATQRNVSLPTTPMASDHQQTMDKLGKLSGADFDKQYIRMMIRDHRKDIKEFEKESNNGMDTNLKTFASSTLPTLRNHLQMAEQIDKGGTATNTSSATSTTNTTVSESTRSRGKGSTVVEEDKSTINKVTPAPATVNTTEVDRTTTNSDGSVREDKTTVNKVTSKP
jgi:putative membrane protein